ARLWSIVHRLWSNHKHAPARSHNPKTRNTEGSRSKFLISRMNIRSVIFLLILSTSTTLAQTFSDYDTKVDFTKYTTYAWLAPGDSVLNRPRTDKVFGGYIMHFANLELQKRGMRIDTLRPQTLILFDSKVADEIRYSQSATLSVGVGVAGPGYYVGGSAPVA